nr:MAG TPA: hypothetical protein [Caudoviricetes sp.]DAU26916.1 MAG TPA: hypothetical protein [Caudoviricetes sp.]
MKARLQGDSAGICECSTRRPYRRFPLRIITGILPNISIFYRVLGGYSP